MTDEEKKLLSDFEARVRHLMFLHDGLKRRNADLKQLLAQKDNSIEKLQGEYDRLAKAHDSLKTGLAMKLGDSDVREARRRLSGMVREVDKCIAMLNE